MPSRGGGTGRINPSHDSDDSEDEAPREGESWFAGGERSGINVQNPDAVGNIPGGAMVRDLLRRAAEYVLVIHKLPSHPRRSLSLTLIGPAHRVLRVRPRLVAFFQAEDIRWVLKMSNLHTFPIPVLLLLTMREK